MAKDILDDAIAGIIKQYGSDTLVDLSKPTKVELFSTGLPSLDLILGGGVPKGRIVEVYGPESSGKTTMALHMLIKAQQDCPERRVAFIDAECAFDPEYAKGLGLDLSGLFLNRPDYGEMAFDITEKLCKTGRVSIIVIDSVASLIPKAAGEKEIDGTANIGTTARLLSQNLPRLAMQAYKTGTTIVFINQLRMKIGTNYGNPETTPGGMALRYDASIRMEVRGSKAEERDGKEGHVVRVKIAKNKIAQPGRTTEVFLFYGTGFDAEGDMIETAVGVGIVKKGGAWYEYGDIKSQGMTAFMQELKARPEVKAEILKKLADTRV